MKTHGNLKIKGNVRVNTQKAVVELKHRVILALNKLADRDTCQIGVEELEKIAEGLTSESLTPFLSCVIDTDAEQKSTVRKECIRIMGMLARFHGDFLVPHLGKIVASIVKRLKDPDSVVREACVEAVGVLASKLCGHRDEDEGTFVVLVKPFFEALGEQNKQVQSGSALCLASIMDNSSNPPVPILLRILTRIVKFVKNPHFMAKPAAIELIRSIIQAGGAPTKNALSAAITSMQDALKSSEWTTRKAASVGLASIAVTGGPLLQPFKTSCICCLESSRFDKVKPVRDSVLQALQYWRSLPGSDSPEPSEAGSSTKDNLCDLTSANEGEWNSIKKMIPLIARKTCESRVQKPQSSKPNNDWHIEIAVPRTLSVSLADTQNEESEDSNFTKANERRNNVTGTDGTEYDYVPMDDKPDCSPVSDVVSGKTGMKCGTGADEFLEKGVLVNSLGLDHCSVTAEGSHEQHSCLERAQERQSLDSTVTQVSPKTRNECCLQTTNALACIQKQLLDIENKQSNLMNLVQVFMGTTMDSLSTLQSKVLGLEDAIDKMAQDIIQGPSYSDMATSMLLKRNHSVSSSPRISNCTPRTSVDMGHKRSSLLGLKNREAWGEVSMGRSSISERGGEMRKDPSINIMKNRVTKGISQHVRHEPQSNGSRNWKAENIISSLSYNAGARENCFLNKNNLWKRVKDFLSIGDLNSAFVEVLCSGDDLILIELLDRTGPILERLSHEIVGEILSILAAHFLDRRFLGSIIPWLQQVVDLSKTHGPDYLGLSVKERKEFMCAIQEASTMDFLNPAEKRSVIQLVQKLRQVWGKS